MRYHVNITEFPGAAWTAQQIGWFSFDRPCRLDFVVPGMTRVPPSNCSKGAG
jgi:hypothetical protein